MLSTNSSDDGPLFVASRKSVDRKPSPWQQSPLLLDGRPLPSPGEAEAGMGLGLVLGPEDPKYLHDEKTKQALEVPKRDSSSVDGFACNVTPPMRQAEELPVETEEEARRSSGFKNIITNAVLQSPTSPGRISAMWNLLGGKSKSDNTPLSPPQGEVGSPRSPVSRTPSGSIRPLALVDKQTKHARRVSLGWHQRTQSGSVDWGTVREGRESKRNSLVSPPAAEVPPEEPLPAATASRSAPQRPSRHVRRVSRLSYLNTEHEIRLDMGELEGTAEGGPQISLLDALKSPRIAASPTGFTPRLAFSPQLHSAPLESTKPSFDPIKSVEPALLDAIRSPRVAPSPTGETPRLMFSPIAGKGWSDALPSSPRVADTASQPGSPWLNFDGSILRPTTQDHMPAAVGKVPTEAGLRLRVAANHTEPFGTWHSPARAASDKTKELRLSTVSSIFADHQYRSRKSQFAKSTQSSASVISSSSAYSSTASIFGPAHPSKALFYAGFLGMPWLWLIGGWGLTEDGTFRPEAHTKAERWQHEPSMREARENDFDGQRSMPPSPDQTTNYPHRQEASDGGLSASSASRTLHTAVSRATLRSRFDFDVSVTDESSERIPRKRSSLAWLLTPRPEVPFYQSPVRSSPQANDDTPLPRASFLNAVREAAPLQVYIEDPRGEARRYSELTATDERLDMLRSRSDKKIHAGSVRSHSSSHTAVKRAQLERFVRLNRILAIFSSILVMGGFTAALYYVGANF